MHQFNIAVSTHDVNRPSHVTSTPADNGSDSTHSLTHAYSLTHPPLENDLLLATELAGVLDEYRRIPSVSNITTILALPEIASGSTATKLDVVIAYLRRVHLMCYYRETCYRDEVILSYSLTHTHSCLLTHSLIGTSIKQV